MINILLLRFMALNTDLRWFDKFSIDFTFLVYLRCMSCECRWMSQLMTFPKSVHIPSVYMCQVLNWSVESCYIFIDFEWWHVNTWRGVISKVWTSLEALFENVTNSQLGNKSSSARLSYVPSLNAIGGDRLGLECQSGHWRMSICSILGRSRHIYRSNDPSS